MLRRFLLGILVVSLASLAWAGVPDLANSSIAIDPGAVNAHMYNTPIGDGFASQFDAAFGTSGVVDATITLTLVDTDLEPIFAYPFADLWLETSLGGLSICAGGSVADQATDELGQTTWSGLVLGGGYTAPGETTVCMIAGAPLSSTVAISHNSADISGDLRVDGTDNTFMAQLINENYTNNPLFAGDFDNSGVINLTDVTMYVPAIGDDCN